jgi:hypothetical protein
MGQPPSSGPAMGRPGARSSLARAQGAGVTCARARAPRRSYGAAMARRMLVRPCGSSAATVRAAPELGGPIVRCAQMREITPPLRAESGLQLDLPQIPNLQNDPPVKIRPPHAPDASPGPRLNWSLLGPYLAPRHPSSAPESPLANLKNAGAL